MGSEQSEQEVTHDNYYVVVEEVDHITECAGSNHVHTSFKCQFEHCNIKKLICKYCAKVS